MKYDFMDEDRSGYGVAIPPPVWHYCHALDVSMSGYYQYRTRQRHPAPRVEARRTLLEEIVSIYRAHDGRYGYVRVAAELRKRGVRVGRHRIARIMHAEGLRARHKKRIRITTRSDKRHTPSPNRLAQRFHVTRTNRVWLSDITYIKTDEGYLFLTVVLDLASRQIIGWSFSDSLEQDGVLDAMERAFARQRPEPGLIFHSDRGSQYTGHAARALLQRYGAQQSMSAAGNCYDNAPMESFFKTLKHELVDWTHYDTRSDAARSIAEFIEYYYNRSRLHSALGYRSPVEWSIMQHHTRHSNHPIETP
jgi:putative transposase